MKAEEELETFFIEQIDQQVYIMYLSEHPRDEYINLLASIPDPWNFGVDPDPDPRIHTSD